MLRCAITEKHTGLMNLSIRQSIGLNKQKINESFRFQ